MKKLTTGFYVPTESFKSIPEHIAVCFADGMGLVAVVGAVDDTPENVEESIKYAKLFARAPEMEEHIAELESAVRTLSSHLEAILQITERDDMSDRKTQKAIRKHAEAFNLLETIDFVTTRKL